VDTGETAEAAKALAIAALANVASLERRLTASAFALPSVRGERDEAWAGAEIAAGMHELEVEAELASLSDALQPGGWPKDRPFDRPSTNFRVGGDLPWAEKVAQEARRVQIATAVSQLESRAEQAEIDLVAISPLPPPGPPQWIDAIPAARPSLKVGVGYVYSTPRARPSGAAASPRSKDSAGIVRKLASSHSVPPDAAPPAWDEGAAWVQPMARSHAAALVVAAREGGRLASEAVTTNDSGVAAWHVGEATAALEKAEALLKPSPLKRSTQKKKRAPSGRHAAQTRGAGASPQVAGAGRFGVHQQQSPGGIRGKY
jgi:hypothetical protein